MMRFAALVLCSVLLELSTSAQTTVVAAPPVAHVTFYSSGPTIFSGLPGSRGAYFGRIFDNDQQLGMLERNRFITFHLAPGIHILYANSWMSKHPDGGAHLNITLTANHHYFISTYFETTAIHITEMRCDDAQKANVGTKPLELKHLRAEGIAVAVAETSFPECK